MPIDLTFYAVSILFFKFRIEMKLSTAELILREKMKLPIRWESTTIRVTIFPSFKQFNTLCTLSSLVFPFFFPPFYFFSFFLFLFSTIREGYFCFISHGIMRSTFPNRRVLSRFIDRHAVFSNPPPPCSAPLQKLVGSTVLYL